MTDSTNQPTLEEQGLVSHSFDSLVHIRKRIRRIQDIEIPLRNGLSTQQLGVGFLTLVACLISYGAIIRPVLSLLNITPTWWMLAGWLLVPPVLVGQRIAKPMKYGKSIGATVSSFMRFHLDDPVHRRGVPQPKRRYSLDSKVLHYQREWHMADPWNADVPGEQQVCQPEIRARFRGPAVNLGEHLETQAAHAVPTPRDEPKSAEHAPETRRDARGPAAAVIGPDQENTTR